VATIKVELHVGDIYVNKLDIESASRIKNKSSI